jgi:hypothetical protein
MQPAVDSTDGSFWLKLSGEGRLPVLHFGMTGMVQVSDESHGATSPIQ